MKLKLFFVFILLGLSLQAQTQPIDSSDELDVIDELDVNPEIPESIPDKTTTPVPASIAAIIPRVYQTLIPAKKQHSVTPSISITGASAFDKTNEDIKYLNSSTQTRISYDYGVTNNQTIGADLAYVSNINRVSISSIESSDKYDGIGNPSVHYKGLFNFFDVSFFGQAHYSFKLEQEAFDTDKRQGNAAQGQNKLNLSVGAYKAIHSDYIFGGFINYVRAFNGEKLIKSGLSRETIRISKGDHMNTSLFMEIQNEWRPNISLIFSKNFSTENTDESDVTSFSDNIDFIGASASGQFQTGKDIFFIPEISYAMALSHDHLNKYGVFSIYGGIRLLY